MALITIRQLSLRFRGPALFDEIDCEIESGQRIGLLGRNGTGKSTFMKILAGDLAPDSGQVVRRSGLRVARLEQDVPTTGLETTVQAMVMAGGRDVSATAELDASTQGSGATLHAEELWDQPAEWEIEQRATQIISRMHLVPEAPFGSLSSGMKRRVLLARALVQEPDVLLLDEPTNHLDVESIQWLEGFLSRWSGTLIFVTHDRSFLQKLATRILELDRGRLFDWQCDYATFLERKDAALEAEEKQNALFDKRLAEEEAWIRQGVKARRTRNMGRVRSLLEMRRVRQERRERVGKVDLQIDAGLRSGQLVVAAKDISYSYGDRTIIDHFSTTIMRGEKVGIIGPNGAGKSTLLKTLLGQLEPTGGTVRIGTNLQLAYFDQLREQLDPEQTVQDNVGEGYENIQIGGRSRHIIGYLSDFLFSAERARSQIKHLSGGERNRVLLAKLFAKPANVIVLDEPTNDLDLETLEILEARLVEYPGTVLMVSHDRTFLDNVVTSTIAFEPEGIFEYDGGYADWERQRQQKMDRTGNGKSKSNKSNKSSAQSKSAPSAQAPSTTAESDSVPANDSRSTKNSEAAASSVTESSGSGRKLKYSERLELEKLPGQIEKLEHELTSLQEEMQRPELHQQGHQAIQRVSDAMTKVQEQITALYKRWESLEQGV